MSGKRFQTIVVGLDYSSYSKKVLLQAQALGHLYDAQVIAVFATIDPSKLLDVSLSSQAEALTIDKATENLVRFYRLKKNHIKPLVVYGAAEEVLLNIAKKNKESLIVVGHKGHSAISRFLLGSTAERLALKSPFPTWIHRGNKIVKPSRILVPHDMKKASDLAIATASRFVNGKTPQIEAFFVNQEPLPVLYYEGWIAQHNLAVKEATTNLTKFKKEHPRLNVKSTSGDPAHDIIRHGSKFDLIVMRPHSHKEIFHALGKVTNKVVRGSNVPVLVVR